MARTHYIQTAFTAGVLDPRLRGRVSIRQYYDAMSEGVNVVTVPMGGVKRRPGLKYVRELAPILTRVASGITPTAPNGGTAANANDNNESTLLTTTTNMGTTNPYVIVHFDCGVAQPVRFADVTGVRITAGSLNQLLDSISVQYSTDNVAWSTMGGSGFVDTVSRTFRFGDPLPVNIINARYWRVARTGSTDLGTAKAEISGFNLYTSTGAVSAVRLIPFERNTEERYMIALTDKNATITQDGAVVMHVPTPYVSADLAEIDAAQSADTMIIAHEDYQTRSLVRESALSWQLDPISFTSIPKFDFNDSSSPAPVSEVQDVTFTNFVEGNIFQLDLEGARTGPIGYSANTATTAENMRREIQKLYTVGFSGVSVAFQAGTTYRVTLAQDSADSYDMIIGTPLTAGSTAAITVVEIANGSPRREDVWSNTRGWPRTVSFHEGRLWFGGARSLQQAYFGSAVNDFFNFEVGEGLDDDAVFGVLNTAQLNSITAIKSGRFLQLFTSGGEFRFTVSPILPSSAPRNQTDYGTAQIKPVSTDGATVFVQRTRKVLRDFLYRYEEDAYSSVPLTALAQHLFSNIVDLAAWQGSGDDDANYTFAVNGDGTIAVYNSLRSQEIAAFTKWTTDGLFKAVGVTGVDRYFAVQRNLNGTEKVILELADEDYYTDCATQTTSFQGNQVGAPGQFLYLINELVRIRADTFVLGSQTSANGVYTLELSPTTLVEIGLNFNPLVSTMPLNSDFGNGDNFLRKKRIVKMRCLVNETLGLRYNGIPLPDRFFDLDNFDTPLENYTGVHSLEESSNWDEGSLVQSFDQVDPLPFHILAVDLTVESS